MFLHLVVTQMDSWNEGSCNGLLPWLFNCQQHPSAGIKAPSGNPHRRIYSALAQDPLKSIGVSMGAEWLTEVCTVIVSQLQCFQFPGCHRSFRLHEFPPPDWSLAIHLFLCPTSADRHDGGWCDLDWDQDGGTWFEFNADRMNCNSWSFCLMECWSWHDWTSLLSEQTSFWSCMQCRLPRIWWHLAPLNQQCPVTTKSVKVCHKNNIKD